MDSRGAAGPESGTARKDGTKSKPFGTKSKPDGTKTKFFGTESKSISFREIKTFQQVIAGSNRISIQKRVRPFSRPTTAPERGTGLRPSPSAGAGRCSRIADVDRIHGEHDNAELAFPKENVHEMFQPDSFQQDRQGGRSRRVPAAGHHRHPPGDQDRRRPSSRSRHSVRRTSPAQGGEPTMLGEFEADACRLSASRKPSPSPRPCSLRPLRRRTVARRRQIASLTNPIQMAYEHPRIQALNLAQYPPAP